MIASYPMAEPFGCKANPLISPNVHDLPVFPDISWTDVISAHAAINCFLTPAVNMDISVA